MPEIEEPANLRLLRRLVMALLLVMILGFLIIVGLAIQRLTAPNGPQNFTGVTLTDGATVLTYASGPDWYALVTDQNEILIYNLDDSLRHRFTIPAQ